MASTISAGTTSGTAIAITGDTSGALSLQTNGTTTAVTIDTSQNLQFNSGYGSVATAYGCRAWVNFNGTGTVAIRASGNVSSITDNGVGDYTVNFTNAMPNTNYSPVSGLTADGSAGTLNPRVAEMVNTSTSAMRMVCMDTTGGSAADILGVYVAIFR